MTRNRSIDPVGRKFNRLTVLSMHTEQHIYTNKHGKVFRTNLYVCACDCGNTCYLSLSQLYSKSGSRKTTQSCGCLQKEIARDTIINIIKSGKSKAGKYAKHEDFIGKKFGLLTVERYSHTDKQLRRSIWDCRCSCGELVQRSTTSLNYKCKNALKFCGNSRNHPNLSYQYSKYPPMPLPYPVGVGKLLIKYIYLIRQNLEYQNCQELEDLKLARLERCCWILVYRRNQGEEISLKQEKKYLQKSLFFVYIEYRKSNFETNLKTNFDVEHLY